MASEIEELLSASARTARTWAEYVRRSGGNARAVAMARTHAEAMEALADERRLQRERGEVERPKPVALQREPKMPEGYTASICTYGTMPVGPVGSESPKPGALLEVSHKGDVVMSTIVSIAMAEDRRWEGVAVKMAEDHAAHEFGLEP
jgi:hypothetical protein